MWQLNNKLINMQTNTFAYICIIFAKACKKKTKEERYRPIFHSQSVNATLWSLTQVATLVHVTNTDIQYKTVKWINNPKARPNNLGK